MWRWEGEGVSLCEKRIAYIIQKAFCCLTFQFIILSPNPVTYTLPFHTHTHSLLQGMADQQRDQDLSCSCLVSNVRSQETSFQLNCTNLRCSAFFSNFPKMQSTMYCREKSQLLYLPSLLSDITVNYRFIEDCIMEKLCCIVKH